MVLSLQGYGKNVFPISEVGEFNNKSFISYKLDVEDIFIKGSELSRK